MFEFEIIERVGPVRKGRLKTPHGGVHTPAFMPVATQGAFKALDPESLAETSTEMILANAYHLYLRPGPDIVSAAGGLGKFMNWPGPILTDSGGFQVMSLASLAKIDDQGVTFRSHIDGSRHRWTPEDVVRIEEMLGPDFITPLDQCLPFPHDRYEAEVALKRTMRWAERTVKARTRLDQGLFAIVQGGTFLDLRHRAADHIASLNTEGIAIGGLSVGEPRSMSLEILDMLGEYLPERRPRYVMGVGSPELIVEACHRGFDLFDCVLPTRVARHGTALTSRGPVVVRNSAYAQDFTSLDPDCDCRTCRGYSKAYLRHLLRADEILGLQLLTHHNISFIQRLMSRIRAVGSVSEWEELRRSITKIYQVTG